MREEDSQGDTCCRLYRRSINWLSKRAKSKGTEATIRVLRGHDEEVEDTRTDSTAVRAGWMHVGRSSKGRWLSLGDLAARLGGVFGSGRPRQAQAHQVWSTPDFRPG